MMNKVYVFAPHQWKTVYLLYILFVKIFILSRVASIVLVVKLIWLVLGRIIIIILASIFFFMQFYIHKRRMVETFQWAYNKIMVCHIGNFEISFVLKV